jgi:ATP-dependent DNA ligase
MDIKDIAYNYKRQTASRYLPVNASEMTSKIMEADSYSVSTKYDGHFYLLNYDGEKVTLVNHGGNVITDLPMLKDALSLLSGKCNDITLAGELYLFKKNGRTRSFDLAAALDDKSANIYFAAFDLLMLNGETLSLDIKSLEEKLNVCLSGGESLHAVKNSFVESRKDIVALYNEIVENQGHEGIVVRSQNGPIYKIKPLITLDAVILGYAEGEGSRAGLLKEILVGLCVSENEYLLFTKVGNGFTDDQRKSLLKKLEQHKVSSDYIEVSGANVAFTMIEPNHILEFSCLDIFKENSSGAITKMCLQFKGGKYVASGNRPMASVIAPVFVQIRTDKKVNSEDAGLSQITKLLPLDSVKSEDVTLAQSEILLREVYVKESKGMKMVRKFMVWKTNKEQTGQYPAYVYHYTDFSPGRAEMLSKEIKVSNSKQQIEEIFTAEVAANVKKGWEKA